MGYKVVITCDRTMASTYHGLMFLGFSACIPQGKLPDWLYYPIFCPSAKTDKQGRLLHANCGMRRVEAALLANGFTRDDVAVVHPDFLHNFIDADTKVVSISSNDPLGVGPATSTFVELWGGEGRMAVKLRQLLNHPAIKKYKPTVFLGGPGSWQLAVRPEKQKSLGIDCVVVGEGDITAPKLFKTVIEGRTSELSPVVDGEPAALEQIPDIVGGTITGIIEVTRGCARSCAFCVPTVKKVRSRPVENILTEVHTNIAAGNTGVLLHGEDMLLYRSDGLKVNSEAVVDLFERVNAVPGVNFVGISHVSLSSIASSPETIKKISQILELGTPRHPTNYYQVGIETGSPKLIGRHMKGKVYPFSPEEWPDVVREGFRISHENKFVCCSTIIMGLPGEEPEDIEQTIELVKSLRAFKSFIVPLLFTPMLTTRLEYAKTFGKKDLTSLHHELLIACFDHIFDWAPAIWADYGRNSNFFVNHAVGFFAKYGTRFLNHKFHQDARKHGARV